MIDMTPEPEADAPSKLALSAPILPASRRRGRASRTDQLFDRELSWLDFNARVLEEALSPNNPLLERLKFLAIFSNNLDEFFMIHVPGMRERMDDETGRQPAERTVINRLRAIRGKLKPMLEKHYDCYCQLMPQLAEHGIRVLSCGELDEDQRAEAADYFEREVFPVLTPLAVDPGHPFPYIANLSLSLAVVVYDPRIGQELFGRDKVPARQALPRLVRIGNGWTFVLLEDLIAEHIERLFVGMEVRGCYPFRVTRNADLELETESTEDLLTLIEEELVKRRFGELERVEFAASVPLHIRSRIISELEATDEEVYTIDGPLNLADFFPIASIDIPELRDPPFTPGTPAVLRSGMDMFTAIRQGDIMLHHPYQSFGCVTDFLRCAAADPQVLTIKHTLYRTSGDSPILEALMQAAEEGKQVACLVELKARFDEENNISWAKQLEKAGVHVVYGVMGLKTHCKVTLVVRREHEGLRRYVHIGTGNYNPKTAAIYTDIGLLTCNPEFGADATDLFNYLTAYAHVENFRQFLVAPVTLRKRLVAMIDREAERHAVTGTGRIIAKMNSLVDPALIKALYAASQRGVSIDLIVRGICCLRPGVPGLSENIRVVSVVGRFLEHSRIFYFRNGGSDEMYIGSADWMARNLDRRVEVVVPVKDPMHLATLRDDVLALHLEDNCQGWDLQPDGRYVRRKPGAGRTRHGSQAILLERLTA